MSESETPAIGALMEPDPIAFSFGAPGWYILLGLLLLGLLLFGLKALRRYRRNKYRRDALEILMNMELSIDGSSHFIARVAELIKRVAISSYGRLEVAPLTGLEWLDYLDQKNGGNKAFSETPRRLLTEQLYRSSEKGVTNEELEELRRSSQLWIKTHRV